MFISFAAVIVGAVLLIVPLTQVYAATEYTWLNNELTNSGTLAWSDIALSGNGATIVATTDGGYLYTSWNSGGTWTQRAVQANWVEVTASYDGVHMAAIVAGGSVWTSNDSGETWTAQGLSMNWSSIASSSDGSRLIASVNDGSLWTSVDYGVSWIAHSSYVTNATYLSTGEPVIITGNRDWSGVASSADGEILYAVMDGEGYYDGSYNHEGVYKSADGGDTWHQTPSSGTYAGNVKVMPMAAVATSADGSVVAVLALENPNGDDSFGNGGYYISYNAGDSFSEGYYANPPDYIGALGADISLSADGSLMAVVSDGGVLNVRFLDTTSGDSISLSNYDVLSEANPWQTIAISSGGNYIATAFTNGFVQAGAVIYPPGAPTNLELTAGDGQVTVDWDEPLDTGGLAITDYTIEYSGDGGLSWIAWSHAPSVASEVIVMGLNNYQQYNFRVSATNGEMQSNYTPAESIRPTDGTPPTYTTPQTINVTTSNDEDDTDSSGAGCSLREAIIAINSAQPYGGCPAGSSNGDTIYLPNGTYPLVSGETLQLYNGSIIGESQSGVSIVDAGILLTGTVAGSIENLSVDSANGQVTIGTIGSNKTFDDLNFTGVNAGSLVVGAPETATNTVFRDINVSPEFSYISISSIGPADGVEITRVSLTTVNANTITLDDSSNVMVNDLTLSSQYSNNLTLGAGSSVDGVTSTITGGGGNNINVTDAALLNDVTLQGGYSQISGSADSVSAIAIIDGLSAQMSVDAPIIDNVVMTNAANAQLVNDIEGATISNISIENLTNDSLTFITAASLLENVYLDVAAGSYIQFLNEQDGATIRDLSIIQGATGYHNLEIIGNGVTIEGLYASSVTQGQFTVNGNYNSLEDIELHHISLESSVAQNMIVDGLTLDGSGSSFGVAISGDIGDLIIRNASISNVVSEGINITTTDTSDNSVTLDNVALTDTGNDGYGSALSLSDIGTATVSGVTVDGAQQIGTSAIYLVDVQSAVIANTTITNSVGGLTIDTSNTSGIPRQVTINNVTISGNDIADAGPEQGGLSLKDGAGSGLDATITNTLVVGNANGTQCFTSGSVTVSATGSMSTDTSCGEGFTYTIYDADLIDTTLADNPITGFTQVPLGSNGEAGVLKTLALPSGSPAIAAGDTETCEASDARGVLRDLTAGCDIGAFQYNFTAPPSGEGDEGSESNNQGTDGDSGQSSGSGSDSGSGSGHGQNTGNGYLLISESGTEGDSSEQPAQSPNKDLTDGSQSPIPIATDQDGERDDQSDEKTSVGWSIGVGAGLLLIVGLTILLLVSLIGRRTVTTRF